MLNYTGFVENAALCTAKLKNGKSTNLPQTTKRPYTNAEYIIYKKKPLMKNQKIQYTSWEYEAQRKTRALL